MSWPNKGWFAIALLLLLSVGAASARSAMVESKLNLRDGPGEQHRVMLVMPAGATVTVEECRGDWCCIDYRGQRGYASKLHLGNGTAAFAAAPVPVATQYSEADAVRVFQWHDREWRDRYWEERDARRQR
jgi:uncharacterized protein YraI